MWRMGCKVTSVRQVLYTLSFATWTVLVATIGLPMLLMRNHPLYIQVGAWWAKGSLWLLKALMGIDYALHGVENIPEGPYLIASKHESAWETIAFWAIFKRPCFVLKRELLMIPFFGWHLWGMRQIAINRAGGTKALKQMAEDAKARMGAGWRLVIFPEGTRVAHDAPEPRYQSGVGLLYQSLNIPVLPVALNSGRYWPKKGVKTYGTVQMHILPPIAPGMKSREFLTALEMQIESKQKEI